jgi:phytoene synthase
MDRVVEHGHTIIQKGSKSFAAASRLFDPVTRNSASMLYAWCRHCDDQTDDQELGFEGSRLTLDEGRARIGRLREATHSALAGDPVDDPVFVGLQRVVERHEIPERYPMEHLDGFVMDVEGRRYRTLEDTLEYCYHVAGVVGVMMAYIMGVRDEETLDRACDLGIGFQLTNISRDVMEDAAVGRVYLPEDWLAEAGVNPGEVSSPAHRESVFGVVHRVLAEAERYYASSWLGISQLPFRSAWAVAAANSVYRDIGSKVLRRGSAAWDSRTASGKGRKLLLALGAGVRALWTTNFGRTPASEVRDGLWTRPRSAPRRSPQRRPAVSFSSGGA